MPETQSRAPKPWWQGAVIYQIYPLTFADANGDGIGDLQGIIQHLDYLNDGNPDSTTSLGIDAIWLSPINKSPMVDNGYDISDYEDIESSFGSLADFKTLVNRSHERGIRIILDLVINHSSNQHEWFLESASSRDNPKADWYIWRDPSEEGIFPNNWISYFGGSAWTFVPEREQYYLHSFHKNQPDLNWRNPAVIDAIHSAMRFWLDHGVDGFRLDASSAFGKDSKFRDNPIKSPLSNPYDYDSYYHLYNKNLPITHTIIQGLRAVIDEYDDRLLIGETFIDSPPYNSVIFYGHDQNELHLPLTFEFAFSPWHPGFIQREIENKERLTPSSSWPAYFIDNHDIQRHITRWQDSISGSDIQAVAKAAAAMLLTLRGTPILYYGQELGMVDNLDIPPDKFQDTAVTGEDMTAEDRLKSRDPSRTPMQWNGSAHAGFSFGRSVEPYLPVHANYETINVAKSKRDPDSVWSFYQQLIKIRKSNDALRFGQWYPLIHYPEDYLVYLRQTPQQTVLVMINFSEAKPLHLDISPGEHDWSVLLSTHLPKNQPVELPEKLAPFEVSLFQSR